MKPQTLIALVAGILIPLQLTTVGYLISIEKRLTRLETIQELRPHSMPTPKESRG